MSFHISELQNLNELNWFLVCFLRIVQDLASSDDRSPSKQFIFIGRNSGRSNDQDPTVKDVAERVARLQRHTAQEHDPKPWIDKRKLYNGTGAREMSRLPPCVHRESLLSEFPLDWMNQK